MKTVYQLLLKGIAPTVLAATLSLQHGQAQLAPPLSLAPVPIVHEGFEFEILQRRSAKLYGPATSGQGGTRIPVSVRLTDKRTGMPIANEQIRFSVLTGQVETGYLAGDQLGSRWTNSNGDVTMWIQPNRVTLRRKIGILCKFSGNASHVETRHTVYVTIRP